MTFFDAHSYHSFDNSEEQTVSAQREQKKRQLEQLLETFPNYVTYWREASSALGASYLWLAAHHNEAVSRGSKPTKQLALIKREDCQKPSDWNQQHKTAIRRAIDVVADDLLNQLYDNLVEKVKLTTGCRTNLINWLKLKPVTQRNDCGYPKVRTTRSRRSTNTWEVDLHESSSAGASIEPLGEPGKVIARFDDLRDAQCVYSALAHIPILVEIIDKLIDTKGSVDDEHHV